jgi:hypothetical protein
MLPTSTNDGLRIGFDTNEHHQQQTANSHEFRGSTHILEQISCNTSHTSFFLETQNK